MSDKNVIFEEVKCPEDRSPIFFVNLTARISIGNSKKFKTVMIKKFVVKGTIDEVKKSDKIKSKFLERYLKVWKKAKAFDLDKITITEVEIIRGLGYGVK